MNSNNSQDTMMNTLPQISGFQAAFNRTSAARAKLEAKDLVPINLEIPSAIATVVGALPHALTLRDQIVKVVTPHDLAEIDAIQMYADALSFAHTMVLGASQPAPPLHHLFDRATELRDLLSGDATALVRRGILSANILGELKGGTGYLNVAYDLGAIVRAMRENWSEIAQRSAVQPAELAEAEAVYEQVTRAFAERERQSEAVTSATADRARAYTLFVNAYDQLRRAATFIRWHEDDADKFVPSLYAGRGGRGANVKPVPAPTPAPAPTPVTASATPAAAPAKAPATPNMPGGSPFAS